MNKIRVEYAKTGPAKFLSHLDLLRSFSRAFRRAHLPIAYTEGYNPHLKIYPGPALATGIEGLHEYLDLELAEPISSQEFKEQLKSRLIEGLFLRRTELLPPLAKSLSKAINCSWFRFSYLNNKEPLQNIVATWENSAEWPYQRPRDGKIFNLKTGIIEMRVVPQKQGFFVDLLVKVGTGEVPLKGIGKIIGNSGNITRIGLFQREQDKLVNPFKEEKVLWDEILTEEKVRD